MRVRKEAQMPLAGDPPSPGSPADTGHSLIDEELRTVVRAVLNLLKRWELSAVEKVKLLPVSADVLLRWEDGDVAGTRMEESKALVDLLAIHGCLRTLFPTAEVYRWIRKPNAVWGGLPALDVMMEEGGIARVRQYLDAEVEG
jgi:hypothetical protein